MFVFVFNAFYFKAKELREELMRRHPNYVYRPKRRSHGTAKNLLSKSCAVLPTTTGPSLTPSSFEQRLVISYHLSYYTDI